MQSQDQMIYDSEPDSPPPAGTTGVIVSPQKPNIFHSSFHVKTSSSRSAIKDMLDGRVSHQDPTVLPRLLPEALDPRIITHCAQGIRLNRQNEIGDLKGLALRASLLDPKALDDSETRDVPGGRQATKLEQAMYKPLISILNYIAGFELPGIAGGIYKRVFADTQSVMKADEPLTFGFPNIKPDLTVLPVDVNQAKSNKWQDLNFFGEVKPSARQSPQGANAATIPLIVTQAADYARLFLSARPFMLYCVGIMIFGIDCSIGIFDRAGITFSPKFNIFDDLETFVEVVYGLLRKSSIYTLGLDPSAIPINDSETRQLTGLKDATFYSSYIIRSVGLDTRQWCTIGPPMWTSLSLLGRGTTVWHVRHYMDGPNKARLDGEEFIMKTSWRYSGRTSESSIYTAIENIGTTPGLAKFVCGGDVEHPQTKSFITVAHPNTVPSTDSDLLSTPTLILHRLILANVGRPLWTYRCDLDLLQGIRDVVQAHKALYDKGILHRDISAGNILLYEDENKEPGHHAFLTDLEFARIPYSTIETNRLDTQMIHYENQYMTNDQGNIIPQRQIEAGMRIHTRFSTEQETVQRGALFTGTAQFMALSLLRETSTVVTTHKACHDLESFIWVLCYAILRKLTVQSFVSKDEKIKQERKALKDLVKSTFGNVTLADIASHRSSSSDTIIFPTLRVLQNTVNTFMSTPLRQCLDMFSNLIKFSEFTIPKWKKELTYEAVIEVLDTAINQLDTD